MTMVRYRRTRKIHHWRGQVARMWLCAIAWISRSIWWQRTRRVACQFSKITRRVWRPVWRRIGPSCLDIIGWLVHVAPRGAARLAWRGAHRGARWTVLHGVPGLASLLGLAVIGGWWLAGRVGRYVLAYPEYAPLVQELEAEEGRAGRAKYVREAWRRTAYRRLTLVCLACGVLAVGVSAVVDRLGYPGAVLIATAAVGLLAAVGRARRPRPPRGQLGTEPELGPDEPFPIADAHTRAQAADCVTRAALAEGIDLRGTERAQRQPWGWEVAVVLRRGTPAGLVAKVAELETTLDLPAGGLLAAPDRARRARVMLRLAERDPFASLPIAPDHAPASLSIKNNHPVGFRMNGEDLRLSLYGVHGVVIGGPGSGKSQTVRTLADAVSACSDAVVWDLDPAGNGLEVLGGAIGRSERDARGIEDALADAVAMAQARPKLLSRLRMGDAWDASREYPAIVVFCDEHPRLTDHAKQLAVDLIRIGRKARVTLILASSEATSDALGATVAEIAALKIMHACRHADVRLVLGVNMGAEGWRPDRLNPATGETPEDAGVCFVHASGARDPILNKIRPVPAEQARLNGTRRAAYGLPRIDGDTWQAARDLRPTEADTDGRAVDQSAVVDVLSVFDQDERLWTETLLERLAVLDARYRGWAADDLAALLAPLEVGPTQIKIDGRNRRGYIRAQLADAWHVYRSEGRR